MKCRMCFEDKVRIVKTKGVYVNDVGRRWRGLKCPECASSETTKKFDIGDKKRHCRMCSQVLTADRYYNCHDCVEVLPLDDGDLVYMGYEGEEM